MTDLTPPDQKKVSGSNIELVRRVISGLVLAFLALFTDYLGGVFFCAFWVLAAALVFREWLGLVGVTGQEKKILIGVGTAALVGSAYISYGGVVDFGAVFLCLLPGFLIILAMHIRHAALGLWSCAGLVYSALLVISPIILRGNAMAGFLSVLWLFAVVWFADIGAFFVGRRLGGPKLWPAISPKKTWSGFIGGVLLGTIAGFGIASVGQEWLLVNWFEGYLLVLFSLGGALISQAGDLFESALKRRFLQKESGHLIPGHGGIMDRLDSFVAAAFYAVLVIHVFDVGLSP